MSDALTVDQLWTQFAETSDSQARDALVLHYAPLVKYVAGRMSTRLPPHVDRADLVSSGMIGLITAIDRFDPTRGASFESYATVRIHGSIIDALGVGDWAPRSVRSAGRQIEQATTDLMNRSGAMPEDEDLAAHLGWTPSQLHDRYRELSGLQVMSLDSVVVHRSGPESAATWSPDSVRADPAERWESRVDQALIARCIRQLDLRGQVVLAMYYFEGFTMSEVGEVLGVSQSRASQLHTRALLQLRAVWANSVSSDTEDHSA